MPYKFRLYLILNFIFFQLRERMDKWEIDLKYQKIGDIMVKFSHFFKMYTEYVKNFENARNTINIQYHKNSKFAAIMDEIHVSKLNFYLFLN